jgi:hypothetical protein
VCPGNEAVFGDRMKRLMLATRDDARADAVGLCWRNGLDSVALFEGTDMVVVNRLSQDAAFYNYYLNSCEDGARRLLSLRGVDQESASQYCVLGTRCNWGLSARCGVLQDSGVFNWEFTVMNVSAKRMFSGTAGIPGPAI